ncbi:MAG: DUF4945 domain-containing protein [Dysgonamonadaceae bacterium]|nr:DUF4945 domain-containing protein [Dysgonamonadaceae bacterium]
MKKVNNMLYIISLILTVSSCIDRDIMDQKKGILLPSVIELKSSIQDGKEVHLQWNNPSEIPSEIQRPLSVYIQVYRGSTLEYQISLSDEPSNWNYILAEPDSKYCVVVKMQGWLKEKIYGMSDEIYSPGQTVAVN